MPAKGPENGQQAIAELLASRIGLRESSLGYGGLTKPVAQGMAQLGLTDIAAYFRRLASDETALHALIERVVVPETSFFRNPESF
ncbi:MAG: chemotaxis protein CheR, partial [Cyanobacteria bacterium J06553_1]